MSLRAQRPWVVIVGGFLGAGKTSLILTAARMLEERGLRCAAILNDQGIELVDTRHAERQGLLAREVTGGCFSCRFSGLMTLIEELAARELDVIFAEPVGSCTDISATVFGPLRERTHVCRLAPFTVLVEPARAEEFAGDPADADLGFLYRNQIVEADLICVSKSDLYAEAPHVWQPAHRRLSAKTGQGVAEWLDEIFSGMMEAGATTLEIDYARYAGAEAALAWLNLSCVFQPAVEVSPAQVVGPFLDGLEQALTATAIPIAHLKILDSSLGGWLKAAVCANGVEPRVEGDLDASPSGCHELLVNLRAKAEPALVRAIVEGQMRGLDGQLTDVRLDCFSPAAPNPERRIPRPPA